MTEKQSVGLTEVLYGVVIANGIYELTLEPSFRNAVLVFALGLITADWMEYHLSTQGLELTDLKYAMMLVLDISLLLIWYLLTIVPVEEFPLFVLLTGVFFTLVGVWSGLIMGASFRDLTVGVEFGADWQIAAVFFLLYGAQTQVDISHGPLLILMVAVWLARKSPVWYRLLSRKDAQF